MAATALSHDQMISAFESRFDYLTARTMLSEVLDSAGVGKSGAYDAAALAKIATAVEKLPRPQPILARLASGPAAAAPAPAAKAEAKAEPKAEPKAEAAPAEAAPAEAAPAEAAPAAEAAADEGADKPAEKKAKKKEG